MFAFYRILGQHYFFCSSRFITVNALPFIPDAVFNDVQAGNIVLLCTGFVDYFFFKFCFWL